MTGASSGDNRDQGRPLGSECAPPREKEERDVGQKSAVVGGWCHDLRLDLHMLAPLQVVAEHLLVQPLDPCMSIQRAQYNVQHVATRYNVMPHVATQRYSQCRTVLLAAPC